MACASFHLNRRGPCNREAFIRRLQWWEMARQPMQHHAKKLQSFMALAKGILGSVKSEPCTV